MWETAGDFMFLFIFIFISEFSAKMDKKKDEWKYRWVYINIVHFVMNIAKSYLLRIL